MLYPCKFGSTGQGNIVDLGTGSTFDVSEYAGYSSFTLENFIVSVERFTATGTAGIGGGLVRNGGSVSANSTPTINKNYDSSTGKLTVSASGTSASQRKDVSGDGTQYMTGTVNVGSFVYHAYLLR